MNSLISMITKRLIFGVLTMLVISLLIFIGVEALPGDLAESVLGQVLPRRQYRPSEPS